MKRKFLRYFLVLMIATYTLGMAPAVSWAHKVQIYAYVDKGEVFTESYFADGSPVKAGKIEVYDEKGLKVIEGATDDKGKFSFKASKEVSELKIVLDAGMGHKAEYVLKKADLSGE